MALTPTSQRNYASNTFDHRTRKGKGFRDRRFNMQAILTEMQQRPDPHYQEGDVIYSPDGSTQRIVWRTYSDGRKTWQYRITTDEANQYGGKRLSPPYNEVDLMALDVGRPVPNVVQQDGDLLFNPATRQMVALPPKRQPARHITAVTEVPMPLPPFLLRRFSPADEPDLQQQLNMLLMELQRLSAIVNAALATHSS